MDEENNKIDEQFISDDINQSTNNSYVSSTDDVSFEDLDKIESKNENTNNATYNTDNQHMNNNNRGFDTGENDQYYRNAEFDNYRTYERQNMQISLPNSGAILALGIISIVSICCCGGFLGPIFSIIALVLVPGAKKAYYANPGLYTQSSFGNLKAGQTCAIIGLVVSVLAIIYFIILFSNGQTYTELNEIIDEVWDQSSY